MPYGRAFLHTVQDRDVVTHDDVGFAAEQHLHAVELRVALPDDLDMSPGLVEWPAATA